MTQRPDISPNGRPPVLIDGQKVNVFSQVQALSEIITALKERRDSFLACTLNVDHLVKLRADPAFKQAYSKASFVTADGFPIVMLARVRGHKIDKTTGSDLIVPLCRAAAQQGYSIYLLGSTEDTLAKTTAYLKQNCPGLTIAGSAAPPYGFDPTSDAASQMADAVAASGARLCLVALGAPLQERFSAHAVEMTKGVGFMGVGASLDFFSGKQRRAPRIVQKVNLEWAWRMCSDPRRLAPRYWQCVALLIQLVCQELVRLLSYPFEHLGRQGSHIGLSSTLGEPNTSTRVPSTCQKNRMFHTLDGLRGIAAICVLLYHSTNLTLHLAAVGYVAVDFFFALSGFVLAHASQFRLENSGPPPFLRARILRLYPLYLLGTALGLFTAYWTNSSWAWNGHLLPSLLFGVLFLPDFMTGALFPLNTPAWSLFFELCVNCLYAYWRPKSLRLGLLILGSGALYAGCVIHERHALGSDSATFWAGFPRVIFSYYIGVAIYEFWQKGRLLRVVLPPLLIGSILLCTLLASQPSMHGGQYFLFAFLLSPLFIIAGCQSEPTGSLRAIYCWLGAISYALYVLHDPIRQILEHLLGGENALSAALTLICSLLVAHVATFYLDLPFRHLFRRK